MAETLSLMEFLQALLADADLRGDFGDDPQGTLTAHGLADLTPADVHDALVLVQDNQTVDYSVDAATGAPPPPPPMDDDHEAAVEYLARYLADPQQAGPDELWSDPDTDSAPAGTPGDAAFGTFGAGDDAGYGAGAAGPPTDDWAWAEAPQGVGLDAEPPTAEPYGHGDQGGRDADFDLDEFAGLPGGDLPGAEPDGPDEGGTALPEGA
jgi:hypothetical protein